MVAFYPDNFYPAVGQTQCTQILQQVPMRALETMKVHVVQNIAEENQLPKGMLFERVKECIRPTDVAAKMHVRDNQSLHRCPRRKHTVQHSGGGGNVTNRP